MATEYVKVSYRRRRRVYIDGKQDGYTNMTLMVSAGTHRFDLGEHENYRPKQRRRLVKGTSSIAPLEIRFEPA